MNNNYTTSVSFLEFAWDSLTDQQKFRIKVKYELKQAIKEREGTKMDVYRIVADKFGYTVERIKVIANTDLK